MSIHIYSTDFIEDHVLGKLFLECVSLEDNEKYESDLD
jgi:hypothetical protein